MRKRVFLFTLLSVFLLSATAAWAKEPATPEFTIEEAVQEAIKHSAAIKVGEYDIDKAYEVRQHAAQNLEYVPIGPASTSVTRYFYAVQQADIGWQMSKKNLVIQVDAVEMAARSAYNSILQAQEKVKAKENNLKSARKQRLNADAGFRAGVINQQAKLQAEANYVAAKAGLEEANKNLDDAYQKFNQLVGLWPEDRPVLTEVPVFEKISVDNLDSYIERSIEDNPSLWLANKNVDLSKKMLGIYDFSDPYRTEPYKAKELEVDKAITTASDARDQARKALRSLYFTVTGLEELYGPAQEQVKVAEENLRVAKVKLDVGMVTPTDVAVAETALVQAKQQLLDIVCQHDILKLAFYKPWAYMASGA